MARVVQFLGGLAWALSRPLRRRRVDRSPSAGIDTGPPPFAGRRRRWLRRPRREPRPGWHQYEPVWAGPSPQADDDGPRRSSPLRLAICRGAGICVLLATLVWFVAVVAIAITSTSMTATVTATTSDGCAVSYTAPNGRHRTGDVDCDHARAGSTVTVWVLSDDPGDVIDPASLLGGGLTLTAAGAVTGAALLCAGRGRRARYGRHEALPVPVGRRMRWWLTRWSWRRTG